MLRVLRDSVANVRGRMEMEQTRPQVSFLKLAGPGLVVAATGIGSGDVVSATVGGARYGVVLLWAIAAGAFFKFVLQEGIARWQLATGKTALEGWAEYLPAWVKWYFAVYLVFWTVAVSASLTNATGLGMANLTGGAISQSWGAVAHSLIGGLLIYFGGYNNFERLMKVLVGVMGFSILFCAMFTMHQPLTAFKGLLVADHSRGQRHLRAVAHRRRGRLDHHAVLQLLDARGGHARGAASWSYVRGDVAIAYIFTAIFGGSIMLIANDAFFTQGVTLARRGSGAAHGGGARQRPWHLRPHRLFDRLLGGGVCVAARRLAERAVPLRGLLRDHHEDVAR